MLTGVDRKIAVAISVLLLSTAACQNPAQDQASDRASGEPQSGGTLNYGLLRDPVGIDPHIDYSRSNSYLQGNIYDTLVEYTQEGEIVGALAEEFEVSEDGREYTFRLREDLTFQDGSEFSAEDVVATFERMADPDIAATEAATIESWAVEALDDQTIRIVLPEPDATLLDVLASSTGFFIVSKGDVDDGFDFQTDANGTGPFTLESFEPQTRVTLVKNPEYWKEDLPYLDRIVMTPYTDDAARVASIRSGTTDFIEIVPFQDWDGLENEGFELHDSVSAYNFVRLNVGKPPLDDRRVRQALNYVIDREEVSSLAFGGTAVPITGSLLPPDNPFYHDELDGYYSPDLDRARDLLREAGFESPSALPAFSMKVLNLPVHDDPGQVIAQQLRDFGLTINYNSVDAAALATSRAEGDYDIQMDGSGLFIADPDFLRSWFHSSDGTSYATTVNYSNPELDELLVEGVRTTDEAERSQIYLEAERVVQEDAPWIFAVWRRDVDVTASSIEGYQAVGEGLGTYSVNLLEYVWKEAN